MTLEILPLCEKKNNDQLLRIKYKKEISIENKILNNDCPRKHACCSFNLDNLVFKCKILHLSKLIS